MNCEDYCAFIDILVSLESKNESLVFADIDDWMYNISNKFQLQSAQRQKLNDALNRRHSFDEEIFFSQQVLTTSIGHPDVKARLEMLMGSNIVRMTDRKYMMKLMARLKDSHEKQQQKRIEERKKQELMRTKNMILHRFIPVREAPIEIRQYPLFKLYLYCDGLIQKKNKARAPKKVKLSKSFYKLMYPPSIEENFFEEYDEKVYVRKVYDGGTEYLEPLNQEEIDKYLVTKDIQDGYMMSQEDYDRLHYEAEGVKQLRKAQTVDELYHKAYEIVGVLYSHVNKERKNNPVD